MLNKTILLALRIIGHTRTSLEAVRTDTLTVVLVVHCTSYMYHVLRYMYREPFILSRHAPCTCPVLVNQLRGYPWLTPTSLTFVTWLDRKALSARFSNWRSSFGSFYTCRFHTPQKQNVEDHFKICLQISRDFERF